jgi:hypothetical protein
MDGIRIQAHELGHRYWVHTNAGTYCLMNPSSTGSHPDCPSHPNPYFKMLNGWVDVVQYENSAQINNISPIETSHQCGMVTIYGKPNATQNYQTGEYYIFENRRTIGFDQKIMPSNGDFKGGMLIWHYSPYYHVDAFDIGIRNLKLEAPNQEYNNMSGGVNSIDHFWGYIGNGYNHFGTTRTHSQDNVYTGIDFNNISSESNTTASNMSLTLNYTVSPPVQYDYVIFPKDNNFRTTTLSGRVFYHQLDPFEYYYVMPNTIIEGLISKVGESTSAFRIKGIKTQSTPEGLITFRGAGYRNANESYTQKTGGVSINEETPNMFDSCIFKNVKVEDIDNDAYSFSSTGRTDNPQFPVVLNNIQGKTLEEPVKILATNTYFSGIDINNSIFEIKGFNIFDCDAYINSSVLRFIVSNAKFSQDKGLYLNNSTLTNYYPIISDYTHCVFDKATSGSQIWDGINISGGQIDFNNVEIKNAHTGISMRNLTGSYSISNSTFSNAIYNITMTNCNPETGPNIIHGCNFSTSDPLMNGFFINLYHTDNIEISNNIFNGMSFTGLLLGGCNNHLVSDNTFIGSGGLASEVGIISLSSNGYYKCNKISKCYYGAAFANSQPTLYQNEIYVNGIGMYVTNNSQVIMTPAYLNDQTVIMAGYNTIRNNSGNEIYIYNTVNAVNGLLMEDGYNIIEDDENPDYLIYMDNENNDPEMTLCQNNYWGTILDPQYSLYPIECFYYDPYLLEPPTIPSGCQITTTDQDNSSQSQDLLLMGNIMNSNLTNDYNSAVTYSEQLSNLTTNKSFNKLGLRSIFINKCLSGVNLPSLISLYDNMIPQYYNDSLMLRHVRNLKIESEVINSEYNSALNNLDEIITHYNNPYELLYASIDKLRILSILDSIVDEGDNPACNNLNKEITKLIKTDFFNISKNNIALSKRSESKLVNKGNNSKKEQLFDNLYKRLQQSIKDYEKYGNRYKDRVINEKILYELLINNYVPNVPPISTKMKFLNKNLLNENIIPKVYSLSQNYPNPFNPVTKINYELPKNGLVKLVIYDILGREVKTLVNELKTVGSYTIEFNGSQLASGIYFYRIQVEDPTGRTGDFVSVKRMVLVK